MGSLRQQRMLDDFVEIDGGQEAALADMMSQRELGEFLPAVDLVGDSLEELEALYTGTVPELSA